MSRWPGWVYDGGEEPDYRFSLANERTLLAWVRTSLALLAAGVAVDAVDLDLADPLPRVLSAVLCALAVLTAATAWVRWARSERAIRHRRPLPGAGVALVLAAVLAVVGLVLLLTLP